MGEKELMEIYNELADKLFDILCTNARLTYQEDLGDFSHGELSILAYLRAERSGLCSGELAESLGMTMPRISAAISGLVKKGLVTKSTDSEDRRKIRIHITPAGIEHIIKKETRLREHISNILSKLGEEDAGEYVRISERIQSIHMI